MTSDPGSEHLTSHHRATLRKIFQHPVSHNIEWHDVVSLLEAVGTVERRHDGKVEITVGSETGFFDIPSQKDTEIEAVVGRRRLAAIGPPFYQRFLVGHPLDDATVDAVVDIAWRAYSPTPGAVSRPGVSVFRGTAGSHRAADRS